MSSTTPENPTEDAESPTEPEGTKPESPTEGSKPAEPDQFPRAYVESLRKEAAEHRTRAADRDKLAERLQTQLVQQTGRLVDGAADLVPYDEAYLTDKDALSKALDGLLEARPYLAKPQRPSGDVGQGRGAEPAPFSLLDAMRGHL